MSYKKNAVSCGGASYTVGDLVLFKCKAFRKDCSSMLLTRVSKDGATTRYQLVNTDVASVLLFPFARNIFS